MGQILSTGWQPEHSDALRTLVASGLSYAESALALNAQFGTSYTRNSAIGRANRIGLACPKRPALAKKPRPRIHTQRVRVVASNPSPTCKMRRIILVSEAEQFKCRAAEVVPLNLSFIDLEPKQCRYPYGDEVVTFCGHPVRDGSSYCPGHHALCWMKPKKPAFKAFTGERAA